jgi:hypothetical protein
MRVFFYNTNIAKRDNKNYGTRDAAKSSILGGSRANFNDSNTTWSFLTVFVELLLA